MLNFGFGFGASTLVLRHTLGDSPSPSALLAKADQDSVSALLPKADQDSVSALLPKADQDSVSALLAKADQDSVCHSENDRCGMKKAS